MANLLDDTFLRTSEREFQVALIEVVEIVTHMREHMPRHLCVAALDVFEDVHLQEEQLLKLQPPLGLLQLCDALRGVNVEKRLL